MTALDRARGWFIAPPESTGDEPAWCAAPADRRRDACRASAWRSGAAHARTAIRGRARRGSGIRAADPRRGLTAGSTPRRRRRGDGDHAARGWPATSRAAADGVGAPRRRSGAIPPADASPAGARTAPRPATRPPRAHDDPPDAAAEAARRAAPSGRRRGVAAATTTRRPNAKDTERGAPAGRPSPTLNPRPCTRRLRVAKHRVRRPRRKNDLAVVAQTREVTSAAVLGRPGEVEPVAAALALALRRETRAATATVAVVGAGLPEVARGRQGGAAARRAARAHGFEARVRGRLAWVRLDPADGQLAAAARRLTLVGAPAVLAVIAPRNADTDRALLDCDLLVIVAPTRRGRSASLAASGLTDVPVVTVRPLGRGPPERSRAPGSGPRDPCDTFSRPRRSNDDASPPRPAARARGDSPRDPRHEPRAATRARARVGRARATAARTRSRCARARGQASILVIGGLAGLLIATVIVGAVATAVGREAAAQRAADLAAVAAAKVMHANYPRLFEPAYIEETPEPEPLDEGGVPGARAERGARRSPRPTARERRRSASPTRTRSRPCACASRSARRCGSGRARSAARSRSPSTPRPSSPRPRR